MQWNCFIILLISANTSSYSYFEDGTPYSSFTGTCSEKMQFLNCYSSGQIQQQGSTSGLRKTNHFKAEREYAEIIGNTENDDETQSLLIKMTNS